MPNILSTLDQNISALNGDNTNYSPTADSMLYNNQTTGTESDIQMPSVFSNLPKTVSNADVQYGTPTQFDNQSLLMQMSQVLNSESTQPEALASMPEQDFWKAVNSYPGDTLSPLRKALVKQRDIGLQQSEQYSNPINGVESTVQNTWGTPNPNQPTTVLQTQEKKPVVDTGNAGLKQQSQEQKVQPQTQEVPPQTQEVPVITGDVVKDTVLSSVPPENHQEVINKMDNMNVLNRFGDALGNVLDIYKQAAITTGASGGEYNPYKGNFEQWKVGQEKKTNAANIKSWETTINVDENGNPSPEGKYKATGIMTYNVATQESSFKPIGISGVSQQRLEEIKLSNKLTLEEAQQANRVLNEQTDFNNKKELEHLKFSNDIVLKKIALTNGLTESGVNNTLSFIKTNYQKAMDGESKVNAVKEQWDMLEGFAGKMLESGSVGLLVGQFNEKFGASYDPNIAGFNSLRTNLLTQLKKMALDSGNVGVKEQYMQLESMGKMASTPEAFVSALKSTRSFIDSMSNVYSEKKKMQEDSMDKLQELYTENGVPIDVKGQMFNVKQPETKQEKPATVQSGGKTWYLLPSGKYTDVKPKGK